MTTLLCFECQQPAVHDHHVIPQVHGGTKTVPLCLECHSKVHGRKMIHPNLVRAGQAAAKARGIHIGRKPGITTAIKVNDDQRKVVKRLKEEGESVAAIARTVQLARGTIYAILKAD